jgi:4-alpha-glucanotransferase
MTPEALLSRLASLVGIETSYIDVRGTRVEASHKAQASVLEALGFDISSVPPIETAIRSLEEEPWRRWIAPFIVRSSSAAELEFDLFLSADDLARHWRWQLTCEGGETAEDTLQPAELPLLGIRDIDGQRVEQRRLTIRQSVAAGYHRLRIEGALAAEATLAAVPQRCYLPPGIDGPDKRVWGLAAHLYTLRSESNWGVGDFSDLERLVRLVGESGGSAVATNPFHALFPRRPSDASPYSPSSRLFLNPIYIDIATIANSRNNTGALASIAELSSLRESDLINYSTVWATKLRVLETLFDRFDERLAHDGPDDREMSKFRRFVSEAGPTLQYFAAFSVLEELHSDSHGRPLPWHRWPPESRKPDGTAVKQLIDEQPQRQVFHQYLQFLADEQLRRVADSAKESGLHVGLIRDLALGTSPDGADAWMGQKVFAQALRCGAPPDDFHPQGQEWGVVPLDPIELRKDYSPYIAIIRANMRHAGGLRIDHVIGLQRQFLMPVGQPPAHGCYLRYPMHELSAILALESHRNECMVIGEDLGTVPEGFRDYLRHVGAFGSAVFYFERLADGRFKMPGDYPEHVAASATTHDLPTIAGYWKRRDIVVRTQLGIYDDAKADRARVERQNDCQRLLEALADVGLAVSQPENSEHASMPPVNAIHDFLASSSARMFLALLDDLFGELDQINVPGTTDAYPNWRRKLSVKLDDPACREAIATLARICARHGRDPSRAN